MENHKPKLNLSLLDEGKRDGPDGIVGDDQGGGFRDDEPRANKIAEDVKDGGGLVVQPQVVLQVPQQHSQGTVACWERFLHVRSIKVLLVENDDSTRHVVTALLRNCNYEVTKAANGLQAWKILEDLTNHVDLILTEVVMPCLSGIGLLCKIMTHKTRKNIPVIMMSSHDSMGLVFKCLSKGAADFLVKPIRKNELKNLWQHVWRRCHSSSGSGSESGTQTQRSIKSKRSERSENDSGSNDGDDYVGIGLNVGDGSDSGSGTQQSSWTKQAAEVDSSVAMSPRDRIADCPDSTCAQVIRPNAKASDNNCVPVASAIECREAGEHVENVVRGKDLVTNRPSNQESQPEPPIPTPVKFIGRKQNKFSQMGSNTLTKQLDEGDLEPNGKSPSNKFKVDITNTSGPQTESGQRKAPKGLAKASEIKDKATLDSIEPPTIELGSMRTRKVQDAGKTVQEDCNGLRHSELSAFSRYSAPVNAFKTPTENTGSGSPLDDSLEGVKKELMCSSGPSNQFSNGGINNNIDMGSSTNKDFANPVAFKDKSEACFTADGFHQSSALKALQNDLVCPPQPGVLSKADERAAAAALDPSRSSHQEFPVQHLYHHYYHAEKKHQPPPSNRLAAEATHCGSSNAISGPVEGNTEGYSLNRSASGSNHGSNNGSIRGSNGQNGSTTAANAGGMNIGSVNVVAGKSGSGDASGSGSGSGNNTNQNSLAHREVALTKFRLKRKERCFQRKVRYPSRKRLAEQRPRVRGQFVRQSDHENSVSAADS